MRASGVAVCIPTYGYQPVHAEIQRTSFLLDAAFSGVMGHLNWKEDLYVGAARNELIEEVVAAGRDTSHILFLDADVAPPKGAIAALLELERPFVSGLYFQKIHPHHPVAGDFDDTTMGWKPLDKIKATPMIVDVVGGGCLLVELKALQKVASKGWFDIDPRGRGEDIRFCHRVKDAGYKIVLDPRVECLHIGSVVVTRKYWEAFKK